MVDKHKNFASSLVAAAPSPATSGTSLIVTTGDGTLFPTAPFNATIGPANTKLTVDNSEIVRVTAISTDTFTITRAQESTSAQSISIGMQINATITAKALTDIENSLFINYDSLISSFPGLVHRWKFEEASGNFLDSVGSLTLTASGAWIYAQAGGPVSGSSGSVSVGALAKGVSSGIGSIPIGSNARTFVLIFKGPNNTAKQTFFSYGTSGATRQWWNAFINDTATLAFGSKPPSIGIATWADDLNVGSTPAMYPTWHMYAATYDGGTGLSIFIDGLVISRNLGGTLNTGSSNFQIAQTSGGGDQLQGGLYDDLSIFTRCLNNYELNQLYNSLYGSLP